LIIDVRKKEQIMAAKIRLSRMGRRHRPFFRINVVDSRAPRDGRIIEKLGHYDPLEKSPEKEIVLNIERAKYWLDKGATPTDAVSHILLRQGIKHKYAEERKARRAIARERAKAAGVPFTSADRIALQKAAEAVKAEAEEKAKKEKEATEAKAKEEEQKAKESAEAKAEEQKEAEEKPKKEKPAEAAPEKKPVGKPEEEKSVEPVKEEPAPVEDKTEEKPKEQEKEEPAEATKEKAPEDEKPKTKKKEKPVESTAPTEEKAEDKPKEEKKDEPEAKE